MTLTIKNPQDLIKEDLQTLGLSNRTYNVLNRGGIHTIEALLVKTDRQLLKIKNLGSGCLAEIRKIVPSPESLIQLQQLANSNPKKVKVTIVHRLHQGFFAIYPHPRWEGDDGHFISETYKQAQFFCRSR